MTIASGTRLGPYEVVAPIGAGGMGEVWRGRDTRLDRSVAIKVVSPEFAQRFDREAKSISSLNHPNICTLYDVGPNYLVMELLDGESLADRLAKGPLPLEQVLRYGAQIAGALDKAHRQGIIHRDLKPGNVMITKSGAKLLDFGLARDATQSPVGATTVQKPLTEEGTVIGTFQYMAPEQLEGQPADARTDIFALGAVLYEMATGRRAFEGKTRTSLIAAIVSSDPAPMSRLQPLTPPALEHIVRKCLAKDPDDRLQSAHDIAEELKWVSEPGVAQPGVARTKSIERVVWIAAVAAAVLLGVFAARRFWQQPKPQYRFTIPMIDSGYKFGTGPVLTKDGRSLIFLATNGDGRTQLFRRRLDDLTATAIPGSEDLNPLGYVLAPDDRTLLLFYPGAVVKRISIDGGPQETIADGIEDGHYVNSGSAISADGTILLGGTRGLRRLLPAGRVEMILKSGPDESFDLPVFLPDGKRFLFLADSHDSRGGVHRVLCSGALGSTEIKRIGDIPTRVEYARGHLFFVRDGTLVARPFDLKSMTFTGDATPVADNVNFSRPYGYGGFSVAQDGTIAAHSQLAGYHLEWVDSSGKKMGSFGPTGQLLNFAVIPGGERYVVSVFDHRAGLASLWIREFQRDTATRVTYGSLSEAGPVISPDGKHVYYTGDVRIYESPIDGSTPPRVIVQAIAGFQRTTGISPDGKLLMYSTNVTQRETKQDLYVMPLTGEAKAYPFLATQAVENQGVFSPDGKWVAYVSDAAGPGQIYVRPFPGPGAAQPVSTRAGRAPRWSPDGKKIYFVDGRKLMSADFHDGKAGGAAALFQLDETISQFEPMRDGRFLMLLYNDTEASPPVRIITNWQPPA